MILAIDATNIRSGGGLTHLVEMLRFSVPQRHGFTRVYVFASRSTLDRLIESDWLVKVHLDVFEKGYLLRALWQTFQLGKELRKINADVLFAPGGAVGTAFRPAVTVSQNLLPFSWTEIRRYGFSLFALKLLMLRFVQSRTFRNASGVIFLTNFARDEVVRVAGLLKGETIVVPHGIDRRFLREPDAVRIAEGYSSSGAFRLLYVSLVDAYKHQWVVARAVSMLRRQGFPVEIDFVGPANPRFLAKLSAEIVAQDGAEFLRYRGAVDFKQLHEIYQRADAFVFASSCENLPNILIEAMAAGLPIASSNRGPMPEVLADAGIYFDPESPNEILAAIKAILVNGDVRVALARKAYDRACKYSWESCADRTLGFLAEVARDRAGNRV